MAGPNSPGASDGPTFPPPQVPPGWIAQWDSANKRYYYVAISTGASQWEVPAEPAVVTPAQSSEHPYGIPAPATSGQPELITHPDGTQTVRYADGKMEPVPPGSSVPVSSGPTGDRAFGGSLGVCSRPLHPPCHSSWVVRSANLSNA